jgi:hypothetical protein
MAILLYPDGSQAAINLPVSTESRLKFIVSVLGTPIQRFYLLDGRLGFSVVGTSDPVNEAAMILRLPDADVEKIDGKVLILSIDETAENVSGNFLMARK